MRIAGHPVHPALVHFPVAFWSLASILDGLVITSVMHETLLAWYCHVLGLVMAVPALFTGWLEFARLEQRIVAPAMRHMMLMGSAWICYLAALFTRTVHLVPIQAPGGITYFFSAIGFLLLMWGGWQGGELVYRHGAGSMIDSSHDDASSTTR
ncbi:MAG: DUF2231 domain-containing protein [Steroidobacter sp.]